MTERTDKTQNTQPAEVTEQDIVEENAATSSPAAVPLAPRREADAAVRSQRVQEAVTGFFVEVFHGPLTKYVVISLAVHAVMIVLFTLPAWLRSDEAPAKEGENAAASAPAQPAQPAAKTEPGKDPLSPAAREERAEKLLKHETAQPGEIPKAPKVGDVDELESLE